MWRRRLFGPVTTAALHSSSLPMWRRRLLGTVTTAAAALDGEYEGLLSILEEKRTVCINGPITEDTAFDVLLKFITLARTNNAQRVHLLINSPGGLVSAGLAIYDIIQSVPTPVATLCVDEAASMASLILAAGAPGQRRALPNSRIMIHQPSGGFLGQATDVAIHNQEILRLRKRLYAIYARHTRQPVHRISRFMERDTFMSPAEAKKFGLIDAIIQSCPIATAGGGGGGGGKPETEEGRGGGGGGKREAED
ncbi:ATP-dependent Clp protease proteolytic subunit 2, mitochondrial [Ananas comosus]|uniref:ATP-dependent Clp protease proteolytic subunit n=1 Tax=Ananas comosus TaxID=4615 RepID=A0A199VEA7_ANACO|nr:ATP-dependent Clp protease proteolytic subunit 2, mitochondrial [Ananas comosus]